MTATTELREAAERIRSTARRSEKLSALYGASVADVLGEYASFPFNSAPLALATAAWLIEEADTLDLLNIEPTTSLAVARHILKAAA